MQGISNIFLLYCKFYLAPDSSLNWLEWIIGGESSITMRQIVAGRNRQTTIYRPHETPFMTKIPTLGSQLTMFKRRKADLRHYLAFAVKTFSIAGPHSIVVTECDDGACPAARPPPRPCRQIHWLIQKFLLQAVSNFPCFMSSSFVLYRFSSKLFRDIGKVC